MPQVRRTWAFTGIAAIATALALVIVPQTASPTDTSYIVAAHRGAAYLHPENTMTGFESIAQEYPDMALEMDVQPLADGTLVIFHDDQIDRVAANGETGNVKDMTTAQWENLTIRHPAGGEPAPAAFLEEILDTFGHTDRLMLIELKNSHGRADFIKTLRPYKDHVILQSFNDSNTRTFVREGFRAIQLMGSPRTVIPGVYATGLPITSITSESVADAHDQSAEAWLWGPDLHVDDSRAEHLDIAGYIVNDPTL